MVSPHYNSVGMPLPQKPVRRGSRLTIAIAVSLIAHALVLPFVARDGMFRMPKRQIRQPVSLVATPRSQILRTQPGAYPQSSANAAQMPQLPPAVKPPEPEKPQPIVPGQVVSLGQPQDERPPEKPTKYLSEHDSRVLKETRARETSAFFKNALSKIQKEGRSDKTGQGAPAMSERPGDNGKNGGGREQKREKQAAELPSKSRQDAMRLAQSP